MRPAPSRTTLSTSSTLRRLPMSTSDGNSGGLPRRSARWHDAQYRSYNVLPVVGSPSGILRSASLTFQAISLALTYRKPDFGSNDVPPHSPPPSIPGNRIVP